MRAGCAFGQDALALELKSLAPPALFCIRGKIPFYNGCSRGLRRSGAFLRLAVL